MRLSRPKKFLCQIAIKMSKCLLQLLDLRPRRLAVKSSRPHSEPEEVTRYLFLPWIAPYPWTQRWNRLKQQSRWRWGQWGTAAGLHWLTGADWDIFRNSESVLALCQ